MGKNWSHEQTDPRARSVESAALAIVIEHHPEPLPLDGLISEMRTEADGRGRAADIAEAVRELVAVGLLASSGGLLRVTPAALRAGELELGL
jgi:hypothetical protein